MIGTRIKELRNTQNLTQTSLAELSGLTQPHIARIEANTEAVTLRALQKVLDALNATTDDFLNGGGINDEMILVSAYRILSHQDKESVSRHAIALAKNNEIGSVIS